MFWNGSTAIDGLSGERQRRRWSAAARRLRRGSVRAAADAIDPHRPGDVLDLLLAQILEGQIEPAAHVFLHRAGDEDPARLGQCLEPRGDVDAVAEDVVALDDDVAEIDADAKFDAPVRGEPAVPLGHRLLHRDGAAHGIDDAWRTPPACRRRWS